MESRSKSNSSLISSGSSSLNNSITTSTRGVQKFYSKLRHKIEDLPPKISAKLHKHTGESGGGGSTTTKTSTKDEKFGGGGGGLVSCVSSSPNGLASTSTPQKARPQHGMLKHQKVLSKTSSQVKEGRRVKAAEHNKGPAPMPKPQLQPQTSDSNGPMSGTYIDSDEECRLSLDLSKISLEDEIFEELEKVAHDEAKLNEVLKNFDKILSDFNPCASDKQKATIELSEKVATESNLHSNPNPITTPTTAKKLQKSKTCSIIESRCILKKSISDPLNSTSSSSSSSTATSTTDASQILESVAQLNTTTAYQQVTKSLWNLKDFDEFARTGKKFDKFESCKLPVYMGTSQKYSRLNKSVGSAAGPRSMPMSPSPSPSPSPSAPSASPVVIACSTPKTRARQPSSNSINHHHHHQPPTQQMRSKSVWELSSRPSSATTMISKIPIMKASSVRSLSSRSNSFCEVSVENQNHRRSSATPQPQQQQQPQHQQRTNVRKIIKNINAKSPDAAVTKNSHLLQKTPSSHMQRIKRPQLSSAISTPNSLNKIGVPARFSTNSTKILIKSGHSSCQQQQQLQPMAGVLKKTQSNLSLSSVGGRRSTPVTIKKQQQSSDILLDKCLEKGHEILRKIEAIDVNNRKKVNTAVTRRQATTTTTSNTITTKATIKTNSLKKNATKKLLNNDIVQSEKKSKFNYATEETIEHLTLESCRIIPPILGGTSDEHAELLVAIKQEIPIPPPRNSVLENKCKSAKIVTNNCDGLLETLITSSSDDSDDIDPLIKNKNAIKKTKYHQKPNNNNTGKLQIDSDSDDSGHISNENDETVLTTSSSSSTSESVSENGEDIVDCCTQPKSNEIAAGRVSKISVLLEKFENYPKKIPTAAAATAAKSSSSPPSPANNSCTSIKIAEVEPIKCIQTCVEIYPNYSKEVTIRLL